VCLMRMRSSHANAFYRRGGRYQVFSVRYNIEYFTFDTVDTPTLQNGVACPHCKMASGVCAVCLRAISTTAKGLLRTHGPLTARCPGSDKPPRPPSPANSVGDFTQLPPPDVDSPSLPPSPSPARGTISRVHNKGEESIELRYR